MNAGGQVAACRSLVPSNLAGSYSSEGSNSRNSGNEGKCGCVGPPINRNMTKLQRPKTSHMQLQQQFRVQAMGNTKHNKV